MKETKKLWWHNLPQCKVGDLVRRKKKRKVSTNPLMLVVEVDVEKPCRAHPCQHVTCIDTNGIEWVYDAKKLEVINENR